MQCSLLRLHFLFIQLRPNYPGLLKIGCCCNEILLSSMIHPDSYYRAQFVLALAKYGEDTALKCYGFDFRNSIIAIAIAKYFNVLPVKFGF